VRTLTLDVFWVSFAHSSASVIQVKVKMELRNKDRLSSLLLLLFSLFVCTGSYRYSIGSLHKPGPGFFPFLGGFVLGLLSFSHFLMVTTKRKKEVGRGEPIIPGKRWKNLILPLVVLFAYPSFLPVMGFVLTTFFFIFVLLRFVEPVRWSMVLKVAMGVTIVSYFIFQYWLKMQFPTGVFGI
jgi:putative tricarboxylic transport membrane protein